MLNPTEIFYIHILLSIGIVFINIPMFSNKINEDLNKWFPKSMYINNEKLLLATGKSNEYFIGYPNLLTKKNIVFKYCFKQDILSASAIYSILIFIFQVVVHELFNFIINTEGFTSEQHFFTLTIVANFSIFFSCSIALI